MSESKNVLINEVKARILDLCSKTEFKPGDATATEGIIKLYAANYMREHMDELKSMLQEKGVYDPKRDELTVDDEATITITQRANK